MDPLTTRGVASANADIQMKSEAAPFENLKFGLCARPFHLLIQFSFQEINMLVEQMSV